MKRGADERAAKRGATKRNAFKEIEPKSRQDWRNWLTENKDQKESVWIIIYKKNSGRVNLSTADVVEEALCFGWIDSVPNKVDELRFKLLVSPRKPNSVWSAVNKRLVSKLIRSGQMTDKGLEKIKIAKANGSWSKLNSSDRLEIPKDLSEGLKKNSKAGQFFTSIAPSSKRAILEWINSAKQSATRERRIQETIRLAAQGIRANHYQDLKNAKVKT